MGCQRSNFSHLKSTLKCKCFHSCVGPLLRHKENVPVNLLAQSLISLSSENRSLCVSQEIAWKKRLPFQKQNLPKMREIDIRVAVPHVFVVHRASAWGSCQVLAFTTVYCSAKAFSLSPCPLGPHRKDGTTFYFLDSEAGPWRDKTHVDYSPRPTEWPCQRPAFGGPPGFVPFHWWNKTGALER